MVFVIQTSYVYDSESVRYNVPLYVARTYARVVLQLNYNKYMTEYITINNTTVYIQFINALLSKELLQICV